MYILIERREGKDLSSLFVSVLEPFKGNPFLVSVERLPLPDPGNVALKISHGERTDYILCASGSGSGKPLRAGDAMLRGRIGFIREHRGRVERMTLVGGSALEKGSNRLVGEGVISGGILDVLGKAEGDGVDGLVIDRPLPVGDAQAGLTVVIEDVAGFTHGAEIVGVAVREGRTILLVIDDLGFAITENGTSRSLAFPKRTWTGPNRFAIATVALTVL